VRPAAQAKEIRLTSVLDPLPAPISGDPDRLQQIVWNLLSNAIKFTPRGGRVHVTLQRVNSHIEIVVADTGLGIRAEFLPSVFDRFSQGHRTSERQGLGLGLGIVRHLTELHGGTVSAASPGEGRGATFTVKLPLLAVRPLDGEVERHPSAGGLVQLSGDRTLLRELSVLIVDDEADARELLRAVVERHGARGLVASTPARAREYLSTERVDLVVSDVEMPGENGYAFIRALRERERDLQQPRTPAVAVTAYARVQDRLDALSAGFDMHVPKPVEPAELVAVIAALLRRQRSEPSSGSPSGSSSGGW
jgi:CheY-like chemotaxis protein